MKKIIILYIGRHPEIRETVIRLLNKNEAWTGIGVESDEEAMAVCLETEVDLVLFGPGIGEESEGELRSFFAQQRPGILIVTHYGGGSGLLTGEIMQALAAAGR